MVPHQLLQQRMDPAWATFCAGLTTTDWEDACTTLNQHLQPRRFIASGECSDVDQLAFDTIRQHTAFSCSAAKKREYPQYPDLCRWFIYCESFFSHVTPPAKIPPAATQATQELRVQQISCWCHQVSAPQPSTAEFPHASCLTSPHSSASTVNRLTINPVLSPAHPQLTKSRGTPNEE